MIKISRLNRQPTRSRNISKNSLQLLFFSLHVSTKPSTAKLFSLNKVTYYRTPVTDLCSPASTLWMPLKLWLISPCRNPLHQWPRPEWELSQFKWVLLKVRCGWVFFFGGGSSQSFCPFQVILRGPLPQMGRTLSSTLIGTTLWWRTSGSPSSLRWRWLL